MDLQVLLSKFICYAERWIIRIDHMATTKLIAYAIVKLWDQILFFKFIELDKLSSNVDC